MSITPRQLRDLLLRKEYQSEIPVSLWKRLGVGPAEFGYCRLCEAELKFAQSGDGLAVLRLSTFDGAYLGVGWFSSGGDRTVRSHVVSFARTGSAELLTIRFEAKFEEVDRGLLFKIERNAVYSRINSSEFRFDPERSKMSVEEFQTLFDNLTPRFSIETFLTACLEPLKTAAASPDQHKRLWLREFLKSAPASSTEKQLLLEILNR